MSQAQDTLCIGNDLRPIVSKGMGTQEQLNDQSSKEYKVGKHFVGNDGYIYLVTQAIQLGDIITVNTNCVKTDLVAEIEKMKTWIGTCTTTATTQAKVATVDSGFTLTKGVRIGIKFTYTNTYSSTTSAPITLNVNGTGAKNIWYNNTHSGAGNTGTNTTAYGVASRYVYYVYDGTYWVWDGCGVDNNTTYSAMSVSELTTGTATTQRTVRADYLKTAIETLITNKTDTSLNTSSSNPIANSVVASSFQTLANQVSTNTSNISANATAIAKCETLVVSVASFSALHGQLCYQREAGAKPDVIPPFLSSVHTSALYHNCI